MWTPRLEKFPRPDGTEQKIGWVLVDEAGALYTAPSGAAITGFTSEEMQALADELNAEAVQGSSPGPDSDLSD